jgi:DNA adenine methylase
MVQPASPLRYPGGKRKLGPFFARLLANQSLSIETYAEPYAGGAGAGLFLLLEGHIDRLLINDLNPGVAAFWRSVLSSPEEFCRRITDAELSVPNWHTQQAVYQSPSDHSDLDLGFATFYLNRCNRSGILSARPIGGLEQNGRWKIDARYNAGALCRRVQALAEFASHIEVTELSALQFLGRVSRRRGPVLLYVDPPYLTKGEDLYMSSDSWQDQENLSNALSKQRHPWVLTYEVDERVRSLYSSQRCLRYGIAHTAHTQRVGSELMFFSRGLRVSDVSVLPSHEGIWIA